MKFFDSLIADVYSLTQGIGQKNYPYDAASCVNDTGYSQVILQRDTAFELSGTGISLVTSAELEDGIIVVGDDLDRINGNRSFARISVVQTDNMSDEQQAHNLIRKIEYTKYHYFPEGYMIRTSSSSYKEAVRVSKKAIKDGISFSRVGNLLISKYKENKAVKAAKIIFVTSPCVDYNAFQTIAEKNNSITKALNHVMNTVNFDCDTCNLKPICDEVEGMRELHFSKKNEV